MRELGTIADDLPQSQRDKDAMLRYNVELADLDHRLKTHRKTLQALAALSPDYERAVQLLKRCTRLVRDALSATAQSQQILERNVVKVVQAESAIRDAPLELPKPPPHELTAVLDGAGIRLSDEAEHALRLFENEYLLQHLTPTIYQSLLGQLQEALEEGE